MFDFFRVVTVHARNHLPAVRLKTFHSVVGEPAFYFAVDGNAVVVVEGNQLAQTQSAGQGAGFVGDTFHHAAVTHEHVGEVIDHIEFVAVELRGQHFFGQRHTHAVGNTLTQRASGGFNARGVTVFRVTRGFGVQLTEVFQIVDGQIVTAQVQQGVNQHRTVTVGQNKAVAVGPFRVVRVVLEVIVPQNFGDIGHAHRGAGVTGFGFLYGVHAQSADRVGQFGAGSHETTPESRLRWVSLPVCCRQYKKGSLLSPRTRASAMAQVRAGTVCQVAKGGQRLRIMADPNPAKRRQP